MDVVNKYVGLRELGQLGLILVSVYVAKKVFNFFHDVYNHCFGKVFLKKRLLNYGKYAMITGCTRGLGLEFSRQLAKRNINLILIARNKTELDKIASEIRASFNVQVVTIIQDLSSNTIKEENFRSLDYLDIGILINNAGLMYEYPDYFHDVPENVITSIVNVNVSASQLLAHYVLKYHFIPKYGEDKGLLVFLSSSACYQLTPMMTCYSASKKYIEYMAKCLRCEYSENNNIFIQTLLPYYIATDMTKYSDVLNKASLFSPCAATYVRHALGTFGFAQETTGYLPHTILLWGSSLIPERVWTFFAIPLMRYFQKSGQRKKRLKIK